MNLSQSNMFPELSEVIELTHFKNSLVRTQELAVVEHNEMKYPLISFEIGTSKPSAPVLGLFGGVHGLEKVGTHVLIAYLKSLFQQLLWDKDLQNFLKTTRIVAIPLINPVGMANNFRSNGRGVDLMRNAPVECEEERPPLFLSGHRISPLLPWYRGDEEEMEVESQVLCNYVRDQMFHSQVSLAVDFHSGFGLRDRLWYPFAKSKKNFPRIQEVRAIKSLLDNTFPHHIYKIEPQSKSYTTHGDLWDYLFLEHEKLNKKNQRVFVPWTLEMGSWLWLKKNPGQGLSPEGFFNPIKEHRIDRTMRRHIPLITFLFHLIRNKDSWIRKNS